LDGVTDLCKNINFDGSEKRLQVQSMDCCFYVAFVSLLLREFAFSDFKRQRPTSLGVKVDSLAQIFNK